MEHFQFILLNQETCIVSSFSSHTLFNGLICCLAELPYPDQGLNVIVNCVKTCSPLKIDANAVDIGGTFAVSRIHTQTYTYN